MKISFSILFAVFLFHLCSAQSDSLYAQLKEKVSRNTWWLSYYNEWDSTMQKYDAWGIADEMARKLALLLTYDQSRDLDLEDFPGLTLAASTNDSMHLKIYNFGYDCGGTRGWIDHPVLQWQNSKGKLFAFDLAKYINLKCDPFIYKLRGDSTGTIYLITGNERQDGSHGTSAAMVIRLTDDFIFTNYPAFAGMSNLLFTNNLLSYNPNSGMLTITPVGLFGGPFSDGDIFSGHPDLSSADSAKIDRVNSFLNKEYSDHEFSFQSIYLHFNGNVFVNVSQPSRKDY
ncbi:MAG TPA: hypothetical protein VL651_10855 [Bacteroidia bacterium]|jgi:hypothetical protein|nr:hypothetical protein [Bacteroidia bacterium]